MNDQPSNVYEKLFSSLPDPCLIVDLTGGDYRINAVNEAFCRLMPRSNALKLSFTRDLLNYDAKLMFLSAVDTMNANKNTSTTVSSLMTLTLTQPASDDNSYALCE